MFQSDPEARNHFVGTCVTQSVLFTASKTDGLRVTQWKKQIAGSLVKCIGKIANKQILIATMKQASKQFEYLGTDIGTPRKQVGPPPGSSPSFDYDGNGATHAKHCLLHPPLISTEQLEEEAQHTFPHSTLYFFFFFVFNP